MNDLSAEFRLRGERLRHNRKQTFRYPDKVSLLISQSLRWARPALCPRSFRRWKVDKAELEKAGNPRITKQNPWLNGRRLRKKEIYGKFKRPRNTEYPEAQRRIGEFAVRSMNSYFGLPLEGSGDVEHEPDYSLKELLEGRPYDQRIYVLGPGAVGLFVAHQLSALREPPAVTMLLHRADLAQRWRDVDEQLRLTRHGSTEARSNIDIELMADRQRESEAAGGVADSRVIKHLIVTVKAHHLVRAMERIRPFLRPDSTVVFLQNGLGAIEEVNAKLFPDEATRPRYIVGSVSHGLYKDAEFAVTHRAVGSITLSVMPTMPVEEWERPLAKEANATDISAWPASARHLMRSLTRAPMLCAAGVAPHTALPVLMRKLAGNAIVNPLTALFDCKNGELLNNAAATRMINMLLAEISLVFRSIPEARLIPDIEELFSAQALYYYVKNLCELTAENESSMLQDIQAGKQTEIDYINGWVVKRGEDIGIRCVVNFAVEQMVKAKSVISWNHREGLLPLEMPRAHGAWEGESGPAAAQDVQNKQLEGAVAEQLRRPAQ